MGPPSEDANAKRCRRAENTEGNESGTVKTREETKKGCTSVAEEWDQKQAKPVPKPPEPPKDYIHVRREKISERMKLLQDLVLGCNKVTGKLPTATIIVTVATTTQQKTQRERETVDVQD
ncbi:transcription factor BHLH089-like [Malania oleifera]|uniref:transcription factor BHLH089-like n=1 Tax=Malania oleifera TaxID=397392 RepID=UPI0025AE49E3|nr:transcription factor BHLH089-like [Malania oleifera]